MFAISCEISNHNASDFALALVAESDSIWHWTLNIERSSDSNGERNCQFHLTRCVQRVNSRHIFYWITIDKLAYSSNAYRKFPADTKCGLIQCDWTHLERSALLTHTHTHITRHSERNARDKKEITETYAYFIIGLVIRQTSTRLSSAAALLASAFAPVEIPTDCCTKFYVQLHVQRSLRSTSIVRCSWNFHSSIPKFNYRADPSLFKVHS